MKSKEEKHRNLIRKRCFCGSPMHPRDGYYRCYNCGKKFPFTKREEKFWAFRRIERSLRLLIKNIDDNPILKEILEKFQIYSKMVIKNE